MVTKEDLPGIDVAVLIFPINFYGSEITFSF